MIANCVDWIRAVMPAVYLQVAAPNKKPGGARPVPAGAGGRSLNRFPGRPYTVTMSDRTLPSLRIPYGSLPKCILMPGDPERAARIADRLEDRVRLGHNREFHTYQGRYRGTEVGVLSTGVGSPGAALASEEAIQAGARVLIRVGTAGSLQDTVQDGHVVVATGAARCEGTTAWLLPWPWPAVADQDVTTALWRSASALSRPLHRGVVVTLDLFYQGVLDLGLDSWSKAGALAVEMECAAIFCVAALRGVSAGAIVAIDGDARRASGGAYDPHRDVVREAVDDEIAAALDAAHALDATFGAGTRRRANDADRHRRRPAGGEGTGMR